MFFVSCATVFHNICRCSVFSSFFVKMAVFFVFLRNIHPSIEILKIKILECSYPPSQYFFVPKALIRFFFVSSEGCAVPSGRMARGSELFWGQCFAKCPGCPQEKQLPRGIVLFIPYLPLHWIESFAGFHQGRGQTVACVAEPVLVGVGFPGGVRG